MIERSGCQMYNLVEEIYDIILEDLNQYDDEGYKPLRKAKLSYDMSLAYDEENIFIPHEEVEDLYICSDFQLGDFYLNKYVRKFPTLEECDNHILSKVREIVPSDKKILHLGDFSKLGIEETNEIISTLPIIENVVGNHDVKHKEGVKKLNFHKNNLFRILEGFEDIPMIIFTHYPISENNLPEGAFNFHGHHHKLDFISQRHKNFVGEAIEYTPIKLSEILKELF